MQWQNRIVGEGEKPAAQFLAHPLNWRIHPTAQQAVLEALLARIGWVQRVVENRRTGYVLDGHLRVQLALKAGDSTPIPYLLVDVSPEEEQTLLAVLDPVSALAEADKEQLGTLLKAIQAEDAAVANLLKDLALTAIPPQDTVSFTIEDRPTCPTCGQKLKKGTAVSRD